MKFNVGIFGKKVYEWREVGSEEELATYLQVLRANSPELKVCVYPLIPVKSTVLNKRTCETRIVKYVDYVDGEVTVYNTDEPSKAYNQEWGYMSTIRETWDINDCIVLSPEKLSKCEFQRGTATGTHPNFGKLEFESMFDSFFSN